MLQWRTWAHLAFGEAGTDWRSLNKLTVEDGMLRDFALLLAGEWQAGVLGVRPWEKPTGTVAGQSTPGNGAYSVADPRIDGHKRSVQLGVRKWTDWLPASSARCSWAVVRTL